MGPYAEALEAVSGFASQSQAVTDDLNPQARMASTVKRDLVSLPNVHVCTTVCRIIRLGKIS